MKDLGKKKSPIQDKNVVELFESDSVVGDASGYKTIGDDEQRMTDKVMDKHLSELETDKTNTIYDIAQYMANLKAKHMQSESQFAKSHASQDKQFIQSNGDVKHCDTDQESSSTSAGEVSHKNQLPQSSEDESSLIIIDKRVDKVFKGEKAEKAELAPKCILKSPRQSVQLSHSPERSKSSPVKIIKVRTSPRGSVDSGKRHSVSLSRDNSKEYISDPSSSQACRVRRTSEGGILKTTFLSSPLETGIYSGGILKRSCSPLSKSRSPDRKTGGVYRKTLSPRQSLDSRSPDRARISPHSSFDARSPDRKSIDSCNSELNFNRDGIYLRSNQSSFDSRSPERDQHRRSQSAHSSFNRSKSPGAYYQYYYPYEYQRQPSPERKGKRISKSLERASSNLSSAYRRNLSPERIYRIGDVPSRSHSAEYSLIKHAYNLSRSNDSLTQSIEHPTCVECLYQRKPS